MLVVRLNEARLRHFALQEHIAVYHHESSSELVERASVARSEARRRERTTHEFVFENWSAVARDGEHAVVVIVFGVHAVQSTKDRLLRVIIERAGRASTEVYGTNGEREDRPDASEEYHIAQLGDLVRFQLHEFV